MALPVVRAKLPLIQVAVAKPMLALAASKGGTLVVLAELNVEPRGTQVTQVAALR